MPELAEVKITSEQINAVCGSKTFTKILKSAETKVKTDLSCEFEQFTISAMSRGKELRITLHEVGTDSKKFMIFTLGMSGYFTLVGSERPKHAHLIFESNGASLCFVDVRRFGKWKWSDWSDNRGPCVLTEFRRFKEHVSNNLNKREFDKPIYEVMMNQRYFNGIGNYLRAEILDRFDETPFKSAREYILNCPEFLETCHRVVYESYLLGGGQLKDWSNPFDVPVNGFLDWIRCYSLGEKIQDQSNRTFWFNPKWKSQTLINS